MLGEFFAFLGCFSGVPSFPLDFRMAGAGVVLLWGHVTAREQVGRGKVGKSRRSWELRLQRFFIFQTYFFV
jgi:hypothetical protein